MRYICLLFTVILMSACQVVNVDVSHVKTDKGFLNSGLADLGDLYVLDKNTLRMDKLTNIELTKIRNGFPFTRIRAVDLQGVEIRGEIKPTVKSKVELEISNKSFIELDNGDSVEYKETFTALSNRINQEISNGRELGFSWFLDEASQPGSSLRYLLVYGTVRADKARIGFDRSLVAGGEIEIPTGTFGTLTVKVSGSSIEEFEGNKVPIFLKFFVIEAFKDKDTGNYSFRIDRNFQTQDLIKALKGK